MPWLGTLKGSSLIRRGGDDPGGDLMKLSVERIHGDEHNTTGILRLDDGSVSVRPDGRRIGYTLEDSFHVPKIPGQTCIPDGTYRLRKRSIGESKFDARYQTVVPNYAGMFEIINVQDFTDVLIHTGNTEADTEGCVLVGQGLVMNGDRYALAKSLDMFKILYQSLIAAYNTGEEMTIEITTSLNTPNVVA